MSDYVPKKHIVLIRLLSKYPVKPMELISYEVIGHIRGTRWARATGGGKGKNNVSLFEGA